VSTPSNPFHVGLLARGDDFADRRRELAEVESVLTTPGERVVLYGDRRLGKSSLMEKAVASLDARGHAAVVVDLATASSATQAANVTLRALAPWFGGGLLDVVQRVASAFDLSFEVRGDPVTGGPVPMMRLSRRHRSGDALPSFLGLLDEADRRFTEEGRHLGVAVDEFQRIQHWDPDAAWALKGSTERHRSISYLFAGSEKSLIRGLFDTKASPLWKQVRAMELGPIDQDELRSWIWRRMEDTGRSLEHDDAARIVDLAWPRTQDVVELAHQVWDAAAREGRADRATVDAAFEALVDRKRPHVERAWRELKIDSPQQQILRVLAAARDSRTVEILSADTLAEFSLGPKSTVANAVGVLVDREWLTRTDDGRLVFDDPFMRRWVQRYALGDLGLPAPGLTGPFG
jgi:hypothetical protein